MDASPSAGALPVAADVAVRLGFASEDDLSAAHEAFVASGESDFVDFLVRAGALTEARARAVRAVMALVRQRAADRREAVHALRLGLVSPAELSRAFVRQERAWLAFRTVVPALRLVGRSDPA